MEAIRMRILIRSRAKAQDRMVKIILIPMEIRSRKKRRHGNLKTKDTPKDMHSGKLRGEEANFE